MLETVAKAALLLWTHDLLQSVSAVLLPKGVPYKAIDPEKNPYKL
jgi:hypothetical protein